MRITIFFLVMISSFSCSKKSDVDYYFQFKEVHKIISERTKRIEKLEAVNAPNFEVMDSAFKERDEKITSLATDIKGLRSSLLESMEVVQQNAEDITNNFNAINGNIRQLDHVDDFGHETREVLDLFIKSHSSHVLLLQSNVESVDSIIAKLRLLKYWD